MKALLIALALAGATMVVAPLEASARRTRTGCWCRPTSGHRRCRGAFRWAR